MFTQRFKAVLPMVAIASIVSLGLTACGEKKEDDAAAETVNEAPAVDAGNDGGDSDSDGAVTGTLFPGTRAYVIGTDIPLGGVQILGAPTSQPAGCEWSIVDTDGSVLAENQGIYVFLTDVEEAATFITSGCGDWEQFE